MTETDPILDRAEAFNRERDGGVTAFRSRGGCTLVLTATCATIARLKSESPDSKFRVRYRSYQDRW